MTLLGFISIHLVVILHSPPGSAVLARTSSVIHLSSLSVVFEWLSIFDVIITFSICHRLVQIGLILSLLRMKWIVLIVSVHICSVGIRDTLRWQRSLDGLTLLIKNLGDITLEFVTL